MVNFGPKPVEEGKEYEVTIDAQGAKGDGIAHVESFVVFVPNATAGEKLKVKIVAIRNRFAIGERI